MSDRLSAAEVAELMLQLPENEREAVFSSVRQVNATHADPRGRQHYVRSAAPALAIFEQVRDLDALGVNALRTALTRYCRGITSSWIKEPRTDDWPPAIYDLVQYYPVAETTAANAFAERDGDAEAFGLEQYGRQFDEARALRFTPLSRGGTNNPMD